MHPPTHSTIEPSPESLGLCDYCERRPAFQMTGDGRPICRVCEDNAQETAWVNANTEAQ